MNYLDNGFNAMLHFARTISVKINLNDTFYITENNKGNLRKFKNKDEGIKITDSVQGKEQLTFR